MDENCTNGKNKNVKKKRKKRGKSKNRRSRCKTGKDIIKVDEGVETRLNGVAVDETPHLILVLLTRIQFVQIPEHHQRCHLQVEL